MKTLQPHQIFYTSDALNHRGHEMLRQYPEAITQEVPQHNRLPALEMGHYKAKSDVLVLGKLKTLQCKDSFRSADYIAPSLAQRLLWGLCLLLRRPAQGRQPHHALYQYRGNFTSHRPPRDETGLAQSAQPNRPDLLHL